MPTLTPVVPAMDCTLMAIRPGAYAELPSEIQLLWEKPLAPQPG